MAVFTTIDDPSAYFKVQLYTGNGSANHAITFDDTDTDMQPDFVWIKNRDQSDSHCLFDSVRGATKVLHSNDETAEVTDTDTLDSFTSDGFQVDADVKVNTNTEDYVACCWKMGTTSGITTDAGEGSYHITPEAYSFNATAKQSIIRFDGDSQNDSTVAHGLGVAAKFVIVKCLDQSGRGWAVFHNKNTSAPGTDVLELDKTNATSDDAAAWYDKVPTATNVFLGNGNDTNATDEYILYAFADVQGYSKFGSFVGNGNADGAFVYTGFRPAFVMAKYASPGGGVGDWNMYDNKRKGYNDENDYLAANATSAENSSDNQVDLLSNGFKWRATDSDSNESGSTYVYMAFAEAPFVNSNGVPCNAR